MKKRSLLFLLISFCTLFHAYSEKCTSLHQQLIDLNKYWTSVESNDFLKQEYPLLNEKELIQLHLFLVKDILSQREFKELKPATLSKRNELLTSLERYAEAGVFPINEFHDTRTPYFIDSKGTACAVGQLIIESGNKALSLAIAKQYNYFYLEDMPQKELKTWADEYGFTTDELKWIQPAYGPYCSPGQVIQPGCRGVGCFNPDWQGDGLIPPVSFFTEYNDGSGWVVDTNNFWRRRALAGQYRVTVTDSLNQSKLYEYTLNSFTGFQLQAEVVDQSPAVYCNGKVTLSANDSDARHYYYEIMSPELNYYELSDTNVFDSLCIGKYIARANTHFSCSESIDFVVSFSTSLGESDLGQFIRIPSPFQRFLKIDISLPGNKAVKLYSLKGNLVYDGAIDSNEAIDLVALKNGLYVVQIEYKGSVYTHKVVKTN